jgi:hypothetical protein
VSPKEKNKAKKETQRADKKNEEKKTTKAKKEKWASRAAFY